MTSAARSKWDTEHSTFFWLIHMNQKHPANAPHVERITGYSKTRFQAEAQDKDYLLKRKVCMLFKNGYFDRMHRVEFYFNNTGLLDKMRAPHILTCFPLHYDIPEMQHDWMYKKFGKWLEQFYQCVRAGGDLTTVMPAVRSGKKTDRDYFINPTNFHFASPAQLYTHAAKLSEFGHPPGAIDSFILKVKQLNNWR